ncbi:hypothetical protein DICVIV_06832 [Dictyocaulus viviparus]|uniref:Conserved oligomeric Golgi complex subunit 2 n=1 Tax=Dictyocaulus viviparus TaxID=29172 RepID=A0A0D8XTC3_DICVI|nr:hypothetical protein DICVIV_06832 [Dictyocaulus viviparus]
MSANTEESISPRIFTPSSIVFDDSQLCFNKNHFGRSDFNVQRFMNLARRWDFRAGLKQIQQDLRSYLKSVQHSMIELINDDYADFVHLSSNLVSLQSAIDKIDNDINVRVLFFKLVVKVNNTNECARKVHHQIQSIWEEFENSTEGAVRTAERVESLCVKLSNNRNSQIDIRHRISFLSALQRLDSLLNSIPDTIDALWLEKLSSYLVDVTSYKDKLVKESKESQIFNKLLTQVEDILCREGVRSAGDDCSLLPCILSLLSLANCTHSLTARLVSDLIYPKLVQPAKDNYEMLKSVFIEVNKADAFELEQCPRFKSMGTVAVPTNTSLFHRCFMSTQEFIENWPAHPYSRPMLKAIRDKFNLVVYFKLVTHKFVRQIDNELSPEKVKISSSNELFEGGVFCNLSSTILRTIEEIWSEDVFLFSIIDKLWDLTLRLLGKHLAWSRALLEAATIGGTSELGGIETWRILLAVRYDLSVVHSKVFDMALEELWPKLSVFSDLHVDTSLFGQCLTRFSLLVDSETPKFDEAIVDLFSSSISKEFDAVSDVPKQYRWTKKPPPLTHSTYITVAHEKLDYFSNELSDKSHPNSEQLVRSVLLSSYSGLVKKAEKVLDSVDATGTSLSRFKKKGSVLDGTTDDDKIRTQIYRDLSFCEKRGLSKDIVIEGLAKLIERSRPEMNEQVSNVTESGAIQDSLDLVRAGMAATWADIKRLVTDLQRVQLSESAKRLSEANCIELVSKLIRRSLIDVIFTRDGYSYITRKHLATEVMVRKFLRVRNRLWCCEKRMPRIRWTYPLTDIATTLGVDLEHVERSARELVAENIGYMISGGELFAEEYVTNLQLELRSLLAECGYKSLSTLCKHWNLSQELLRSLLLDRLPEDFNGVVDGDSIFTMEYLESHKNILRALLSAITKPLSVTVMQARVGLPINRFWWAFDKLLETGEVMDFLYMFSCLSIG